MKQKSQRGIDKQSLKSLKGGRSQALPFTLSKGILILFTIILVCITISGSGALLSSPIHPIALVLGILIPAYLFLLFALIRKHSLFSDLLIFVQKQAEKLQNSAQKLTSKQEIPTVKTDPQLLTHLAKVIMHYSWSLIFASLIISFFYQFTLKQYHFNLFSTLFPYESGFYYKIIQILNWLPDLLFGELISPTLVEHSLNNTPTPIENAIWARWIIIMIMLYGLIPRLILLIIARRNYRQYLLTNPQAQSIQQGIAKLIDPAREKPKSERSPKTVRAGNGELTIALDYAGNLGPDVIIINDRNSFNQLHSQLEESPLQSLIIYIDSQLTPDRSLLRRLYALMNLALQNEIILVQNTLHARVDEWRAKLIENLYENEKISVQSHN